MVPSMRAGSQRGFTLVAVLAAMFILALGTQKVMTFVSTDAQRDREAHLLLVGQAYVRAIGTYYESSPGGIKRWPRSLEDLADDTRFVGIKRHIREVYPDPISRQQWGIVASPDGGVAGVYSLSEKKPIRTAALDTGSMTLPAAGRYMDWQFVYIPKQSGINSPG
jgi:type II secretory pathway pseudopilin PulG